MHHGLPSRRTRARWTQNKQKTMRNACALHNFSTLDKPGHCNAEFFPRSSCFFDFFSLSERWIEVEQDVLRWFNRHLRLQVTGNCLHVKYTTRKVHKISPPWQGMSYYIGPRVPPAQTEINHYDQACFSHIVKNFGSWSNFSSEITVREI